MFLATLLTYGFSAGLHARAETSNSVRIEDLTWTELQKQVTAGKTCILIPVGGTEQSGPHIALGKHNFRAYILSKRIAEESGRCLVAPVIAYVPEGPVKPPSGHMRFTGTITVPTEVFEQTLSSAAQSFATHGFTDIVFLGDHGGYQSSLKQVSDKLNQSWGRSGPRAHALLAYYDATQQEFVQKLTAQHYSGDEIGKHAGLADTSLSMALAPETVRPGEFNNAANNGQRVGVVGDPRRASAELGRLGVDLIVKKSLEALRTALAR